MGTSRTITSHGGATSAWATDAAQGSLGYVQVTANQGSITTEVDLTSLTRTITVVGGRRIKITGSVYAANTGANNLITLKIFEDGSQVMERSVSCGSAGVAESLEVVAVRTPSAGSHTWKLRMITPSGTATMAAAATYPAFLLVEDIGT